MNPYEVVLFKSPARLSTARSFYFFTFTKKSQRFQIIKDPTQSVGVFVPLIGEISNQLLENVRKLTSFRTNKTITG